MNQPPPRDVPAWSTRQVIFATLFIVSVLAAFWLLYRFSREIFILFVAIVLGTAIRPVVDWLNRRGISRTVSVIIIYFLLFAIVVGMLVAILPLTRMLY
jgi:predicted PurR-regulated permease PerM